MVQSLWKKVCLFKHKLTIWLSNSKFLESTHNKWKHTLIYIYTKTCTQMFTAALFIIGPNEITQSSPRWCSSKESACWYRRCRFDTWARKISWRRKEQPTPVFLPGKFHGQRSLVGCSPWGLKELDRTEHTCTKMIQMSINWWLDKQNVVYPCSGILFSNKKEEIIDNLWLWHRVGLMLWYEWTWKTLL